LKTLFSRSPTFFFSSPTGRIITPFLSVFTTRDPYQLILPQVISIFLARLLLSHTCGTLCGHCFAGNLFLVPFFLRVAPFLSWPNVYWPAPCALPKCFLDFTVGVVFARLCYSSLIVFFEQAPLHPPVPPRASPYPPPVGFSCWFASSRDFHALFPEVPTAPPPGPDFGRPTVPPPPFPFLLSCKPPYFAPVSGWDLVFLSRRLLFYFCFFFFIFFVSSASFIFPFFFMFFFFFCFFLFILASFFFFYFFFGDPTLRMSFPTRFRISPPPPDFWLDRPTWFSRATAVDHDGRISPRRIVFPPVLPSHPSSPLRNNFWSPSALPSDWSNTTHPASS